MYYYINKEGQQAGPVAADQLPRYGVNAQTMVWKAGMTQWTKAADVPELQSIIPPMTYGQQAQASYSQQGTQNSQQSGNNVQKPNNNMILAIFCTACCCMPLGAYSIYCAAQVDSYFKNGNYSEAEEWAAKAKKWSTIGLVAGFIIQGIYTIIYIAGGYQ